MKHIASFFYIIYQLCVALPVILAATILTALVTSVGCILGNPDVWGYYPGMIWSRTVCTVLLLPVRRTGMENIEKGKPYIIVSNHQSALDVFLLYGYLGVKFKWMMKKEIEKIPLVGAACRRAGFIYIDRSSIGSGKGSIEAAEETLSRGMSMIIFPEGTRTGDGRMSRFKKGAFLLAVELGMPLLPVTINGAYRAMSRKAWHVTWHPMSITVHKPIEVERVGASDESELNASIRQLSDLTAEVIASKLD